MSALRFSVRIFPLSFGRVCVQICYDINFYELWHQCRAHRADIVAWPSAMHTPDPFVAGYTRIFQYAVLAVGFPGNIVDATGEDLSANNKTSVPKGFPKMQIATLDLDRTFVHWDNNTAKVKQMLADHPGEIAVDVEGPPFFYLRSTKPGTVSVRRLCAQYGIETGIDYADRSRRGLNSLRHAGLAIP